MEEAVRRLFEQNPGTCGDARHIANALGISLKDARKSLSKLAADRKIRQHQLGNVAVYTAVG